MFSPNDQAAGEQDHRLLTAVGKGDGGAFWTLWEQHRDYLYQLCLRRMNGNRADAEDALSQAMMKAWDRLPTHAPEVGNPRAWLAQLSRNLCTDLQRERQRKDRLMSRLEVMAELIPPAAAPSEEYLETAAPARQRSSNWRRLIGRLPVRLREPFLLRFVRQWPYDRIALRLALSTANVRKRIQEARVLLRRGLAPFNSPLNGRTMPGVDPVQGPERRHGLALATTEVRQRKKAEIVAPTGATHFVRVRLASGAEMDFHLFLEKTPARQRQKIQTWRAYVRRHPGGWKKRLELADLLYETGDWDDAIAGYVEVLKQRPWETRVSLRLGRILRGTGHWQEAGQVYERALALAQQPAARRHLEGLVATCAHDYPRAAADFREAARLEPGNTAHWHALADACFKAGCPGESLQALEQALRMNPRDLVALSAGHAALMASGKLDEAQRRLERVLELAPNDVLALQRLAELRCQSGLLEGEQGKHTRGLIRRGLRRAPYAAGLHEALAGYHIGRGQWKRGLTVLRNYVKQHPNSPVGWYQLARWLSRRGHNKEAAEALKQALKLELPSGGPHNGFGRMPEQ